MSASDDPKINPERGLAVLLDIAWPRIAASGWNRYQLYGRGALLASKRMLEGKSFDMNYLTPSLEAPLPDWLASAVESYDPAKAVVVVFVDDHIFETASPKTQPALVEEYMSVLKGSAYFWVVSRQPAPPECAKGLAN